MGIRLNTVQVWALFQPQRLTLHSERLQHVMQDATRQPDASRVDRSPSVDLAQDAKVEELMKGLLEDAQWLAARQTVRAATEEKLEGLTEAIDQLSTMAPSIPCQETVYMHDGTGNQFINARGGSQNINIGSGQCTPSLLEGTSVVLSRRYSVLNQ